jgi:diacylglycerol kinase (ATP)
MQKKVNDINLIYNPYAGQKLRFFGGQTTSLEDIKYLIDKYQLQVDYTAISKNKRAKTFAEESVKDKYKIVLAAGGDGTVNEVANGLVNSSVILGILPLGTFMNIARMLSIKNELEYAIMLLKIGRTRKIDVGSVTRISGAKMEEPFYFLETAGIGLDAELHELFKLVEKGRFSMIIKMIQTFINFYSKPIQIEIDGKERTIKSTLITISNGPYTGAALNIAPVAKLNDHKLTIGLYRMSKWELLRYFIDQRRGIVRAEKKLEMFQADLVRISSKSPRAVHADATLFGYTPVSLRVVPNALNVICGFPNPDEEPSLKAKTWLDP